MKRLYWCSKKTEEKIDSDQQEESSSGKQFIFLNNNPGENACSMSNNNIDVIENMIMFYGEINDQNAMMLNKIIRSLDKDLQIFKIKFGTESPPIKLFINSNGGSIFSGLSIVDAILSSVTPVHTYIDGNASSAATLVSIVGKKRFMFDNSFMLIHQLRGGMWGKFEDFKDEMENLEMFMEKIKNIYAKYTKMNKKQITDFLKREKYFDSHTCLELGLIDEIATHG